MEDLELVMKEKDLAGCTVLVPEGRIIAGPAAEEFDRRVQALLAEGKIRLIADLHNVPRIDSTGICGIVRGFITAQRLGGSFSLVHPNSTVSLVLKTTKLDSIIPVFDSVEDAQKAAH